MPSPTLIDNKKASEIENDKPKETKKKRRPGAEIRKAMYGKE